VETTEHVQEDLIPSHVEVTRFLHHRYWCSRCRKSVRAPYAPEEVPHGHLGPRALATMVWFKYHLALPGNKIRTLLQDFCGLTVSEGAISQALQRLAGYFHQEADHILQEIRRAPRKHADETGWTVNGASRWLWTFLTERWVFNHIDPSRGSRVPKTLLGHPFRGVLSSDFFSAYNRLSGRKQKCLVHFWRDVRKARSAFAHDPPAEFLAPQKKLRRLLADARRLADRRTHLPVLVYARRVRRLKDRLFAFATGTFSHPVWQRLSARLLKHHREILTFLDVPGVPPDNNAAERAIRPHVILRNRSFQNRTDDGARAHGVLSSLVQTLLAQGRHVVDDLARVYPIHRRQRGLGPSLLFTSNR
jgi:transposase